MKSVSRLYQNFQPKHYDLKLVVDPEAMTFSGSVTIEGKKVGRPSQRITLHQKDLKIASAKIVRHDKKGSEEKKLARINLHKGFDEVRLHSSEMLYGGDYTVELEFSGKITEPMNGIYPCFFEHEGKAKKLIATQFESHHAREAFPCIDEPEAKATFDLTLVTPKGQTVIANTPVKSEKTIKTATETVFETTPKMSTYLLAFAFGELGCLEAKTKDGVLVRTYATPDNVQFTQFALDTAVKCLEFYNDYFDIPYPLAKCDMIALPDFASGAMENWGLITYREQALIVDPKNTSLSLKQYVAMVVGHELAHQWFGNLVTMRWWTDLWLNEGFASWIEYLSVDQQHPDWQMWTQFIVDEQQTGMRLDELEHTHPIEVPVHHPDEIRTIFDSISYSKGASVIHMLQHYLGADTFRDGLRHYLKQHAYGNTDTVDLWAALEHVSGKPVKEFMHAWTSQPGFPIVAATIGEHEMRITQERFYLNPQAQKTPATWPVPLLGQGMAADVTLEKLDQTVPIDDPHSLLLNAGRSGFYRVVYDSNQLARLTKLVEAGKLSPLGRLGLLGDAFEAAKAGLGSSVDVLKLLAAYKDEDDNAVWEVIASNIGSIRMVMNDDTVREALKPYVRQLTAKQVKRLGWEAKQHESHFDSLLRPTILAMASLAEEPSVVKEALQRFSKMKKPEDVHPDLRGVVYGTAVRQLGDSATFDKLFAMHEASKNSEERVTLAAALTGFEDKKLIERALALITTKSVRLQDAAYWVAYSFGNRHARDLTWEWLKLHWNWLEKKLGTDLSFYRMPIYAARCYSDAKFLPEFKAFFEGHMSAAFDRPVNQAIETIQWQAAWRTRDLKPIQTYLKSK